MRLRHPLVHHRSTTAADQVPKPVAQEPVLFEGDDGLAVLPAQAQVVAPAVLAPLDWHLISRHVLHPSSATQHTTETENSQGHGELLSNCYQFPMHFAALLIVNGIAIPASQQSPSGRKGLYCFMCRNF